MLNLFAIGPSSARRELADDDDPSGSEDSTQAAKASLSRHVTSVISHFTATTEGYKRLLNEIDDFLHVVSPSGVIMYCSPSVKRFLGYSADDLAGHHISEVLHREDRQLLFRHINTCLVDRREYFIYIRYQKKTGDFVLLEVRGRPLLNGQAGEIKSIIHTGREYRSKASLSIDSLLEYRIENLRLRRQLENELRKRGTDPPTHPLLQNTSRQLAVVHPDHGAMENHSNVATNEPRKDSAGSLVQFSRDNTAEDASGRRESASSSEPSRGVKRKVRQWLSF